jgi:hypothetical protein
VNDLGPGSPGLSISGGHVEIGRPCVPGADHRGAGHDLCPTLRTIRLRIGRRLGAVDREILASALPVADGAGNLAHLQRERASLVLALELVAAASDRGIDRAARRRWLEMLIASAPASLGPRARRRLRHLVDGLDAPP